MTGAPSIHHQRRWFYALWIALLLLSAGLWALWQRPVARFQASLVVQLRIQGAPPATQVQIWNGPRSRWPDPHWNGADGAAVTLREDGTGALPLLRVQAAVRRWVKKTFIPRDTWDLVVVKFTAPGEPPRYFPLPLEEDLRGGLLRPGRRLTTTLNLSWKFLQAEPKVPDRIP